LLLCSVAVAGIADPAGLTMEQALKLARTHSPELRAARMHSLAAEKGIGAAGLWENPELEFEAEGIGWDNDLFSEGEYSLGLVQEFQLGGKREKDRAVALESVAVASQAMLEKELELAAEVRRAFVEVAVQQETDKVRSGQEELGRAFVEVAQRRHKAGGGSELEVVQAELALEEIILSRTCCFGDLQAAQEKLSSLIGVPVKAIGQLDMPYFELETFERLVVDDSHPALQHLEAEAGKVRAEARRAGAQDISNISLGAGYRYEAAGDINTFVFSASMPLGFNKRGRAEHAAGLLRADAVQAEREEVLRKLQAELASLLALYDGAKAEVELTKDNLMPKAEQAYELSREGYGIGRFSWLELIAAQQNLADIRIRYIESLRDAHLAHAQISKFMKEGIQP
jgi:outer membrane protein, heavy metal efflux system